MKPTDQNDPTSVPSDGREDKIPRDSVRRAFPNDTERAVSCQCSPRWRFQHDPFHPTQLIVSSQTPSVTSCTCLTFVEPRWCAGTVGKFEKAWIIPGAGVVSWCRSASTPMEPTDDKNIQEWTNRLQPAQVQVGKAEWQQRIALASSPLPSRSILSLHGRLSRCRRHGACYRALGRLSDWASRPTS